MTAEEGSSRRATNGEKEEEETTRDERGGKSLAEEDKGVGKIGESSDLQTTAGEFYPRTPECVLDITRMRE